ncbi:GapS6a family protein [Thiothrix subterranea]|uniref:Uncharacterized protein n=1 Tax=Thiothrix subterranea TaxID=2735563 RepID=A0AA51R5U2_9GAMM|nr:hypothetical protein [Thiothrix subterranea]MDQ5766979.1 hypothetical protein [Thiothrix subterranea]WML88160.1 hypothetical protein RCG00_07230 [Thiothrix subterranea]
MDFLSAAVLSGITYDILKNGLALNVEHIKERLKEWVGGEVIAPQISIELNKLDLNEDMSETAIEKRINQSEALLVLLSSIKKEGNNNTITQYHTGSGDNVGRDKIIK